MTALAHLKPQSLFKFPLLTQFTHLKLPKMSYSSDTSELNTESELGKRYQLFQTQE